MTLDELRASRSAVVTVAETASLLDVDPRTVLRGCETGQLPSITVGRRVLIPRLRLLAMLDADGERALGDAVYDRA
jgi:excisionase family DNA binding protein